MRVPQFGIAFSILLPVIALGLGGDLASPSISYRSDVDAATKKKIDEIDRFMNDELKFLEGSFINQFTYQRFGSSVEKVLKFLDLLEAAAIWEMSVQFRDFGEQDSAFSLDQASSNEYLRVMVNAGREDFNIPHFKAYLPPPSLSVSDKIPAGTERSEILYLHCFRTTWGMKVPPTRDGTPATPPERMLTLRVTPGVEFEVHVGKFNDQVKGMVSRTGDALHAKLQGGFGSSVHAFEGKVELEKPFDPDLLGFSSAVMPFRVVLSKSMDIEPFLEKQPEIDQRKLEKATKITRENEEKEGNDETKSGEAKKGGCA